MTPNACIRPLAAALLSLAGFAHPATAQEACTSYTVQAGDTLGSISMAAYGAVNYQLLYNANLDALRSDPSDVPVGTVLQIPCADGRLTAAADIPEIPAPAAAATPAADATPEAEAESAGVDRVYRPEIRIVTGDDWVPFGASWLSGGGLYPRITMSAIDRAGPEYRHSIGWVDDWESHIFVLLQSGAFDLLIGWNDPNCGALANPSERTLFICENFIFSDPIYQTTFGFFSVAGNPFAEAGTFADLAGARICRAEGNLHHDLEAVGLVEPFITKHIELDEGECLEGVLEGRYDLASFETQYAPFLFADLGMEDQFVQNASLATIQSAAAVAYAANPRARAYVDHLNRGLAILRASGEWADIVASTQAEAESIYAAPVVE